MKHESEYVELVRELFEPEGDMEYNEETKLLLLLNGPDQYGNEEEMLEFLKDHRDITMDELIDYWDSIAPDGLAPGDDGEDLLEED